MCLFFSAAEEDSEDDNRLQLVLNIVLLQDIQMPFWDALTGIKYRNLFFYSAWH